MQPQLQPSSPPIRRSPLPSDRRRCLRRSGRRRGQSHNPEFSARCDGGLGRMRGVRPRLRRTEAPSTRAAYCKPCAAKADRAVAGPHAHNAGSAAGGFQRPTQPPATAPTSAAPRPGAAPTAGTIASPWPTPRSTPLRRRARGCGSQPKGIEKAQQASVCIAQPGCRPFCPLPSGLPGTGPPPRPGSRVVVHSAPCRAQIRLRSGQLVAGRSMHGAMAGPIACKPCGHSCVQCGRGSCRPCYKRCMAMAP